MSTTIENKPAASAGAPSVGVAAGAPGYAPMVGDRFHKPAGTYECPLTGKVSPTPERNAEVKTIRNGHVFATVDGVEGSMRYDDFVRLAENTLKHGSTLTRA